MTWTKIDANLPYDPDLLKLPRGIRWMHVEAMVWANQQSTDGLIPRHAFFRITDQADPEQAASQLVEAGLWSVADDGWTIVGFLDHQPSSEDKERTNALSRERQRRRRQHMNGDHALCQPESCRAAASTYVTRDNTRDIRGGDGVSHDTRTVPTDPYRPLGRGGRSGTRPDGARSAGATRTQSGAPHIGPPPGTVIHLEVDEEYA